jgi:hypothetical protein
MIVSWTQTHTNDRDIHFKLLQFDIMGNYVRNKCDKIIFSFHNSSQEYTEKCTKLLKNIYEDDKIIIMNFDNITYVECILRISQKIKEIGGDSIINIQDDDFFMNSENIELNKKHIDLVFDFYKSKSDINHFNLFSNVMMPDTSKNIIPLETLSIENGLEIYRWNTQIFIKNRWNELVNRGWPFSWQNGPCILKISHLNNIMRFAISHVGKNKSKQDPWTLEQLFGHFYNNHNPEFYGTNQVFFKTINMIGKFVNRNISLRDNAARFFGKLDTWNDVLKILHEWENKE